MRSISALLLACSLCGPLYLQAAGAPVQTVDSLAERACEARVVPLPQVRLVKDVLAAMPDKCNEKLMGTWYCGIRCGYENCRASRGEVTFQQSVDPDGYERIHKRLAYPDRDVFLSEYRVERKWGNPIGNDPSEKGKLVNFSCNGKTRDGQGTFTVNIKTPDGNERHQFVYGMNPDGESMRRFYFSVRWEGDTAHKKLLDKTDCWRELKP